MSVFRDYSNYYDLLYQDKDYYAEVNYIHQLIQGENPGAKTILNLGCGTGKHDYYLHKLGYEIVAVDISEKMIEIAKSNDSANIEFIVGDIRKIQLNQSFDAVISMFHVMSYQTTDYDLEKVFNVAKIHLNPGGVFIFDCWNGSGVLADPPQNRRKNVENEILKIQRETIATHLKEENAVNVHFDVDITDKNASIKHSLSEDHLMRYLFPEELNKIGSYSGLIMNHLYSWMTTNPPEKDDWYVLYIFK